MQFTPEYQELGGETLDDSFDIMPCAYHIKICY